METLQNLFQTGQIVNLILALVVVEAIALIALRKAAGRGPSTAQILSNLAAGAALLLATRSALAQEPWVMTAAWLGAALVAHVFDLLLRWR